LLPPKRIDLTKISETGYWGNQEEEGETHRALTLLRSPIADAVKNIQRS